MTWLAILKKSNFILAALLLVVLPACKPGSEQPEVLAWLVGGGDCSVEARLLQSPEKLKPTPIELVTRAGCPTLRSATVSIDMPDMPMRVAPVILVEQTGEQTLAKWHGELVFTMGGYWRVEVKVVDSRGSIGKGIHDLHVR